MAGRRGNNEGSIYFHITRKRWCAQVSLDGRRVTKYGKSQKERRAWMEEMLTKIERGLTFEGTQMTFKRFMEIWLNGKELSRRPRTVYLYRQTAEHHILPILGYLHLQKIHPSHIQQLYAIKRAEGTGARTIQLVHAILHNAFRQALRQGILGRSPMDAIERPKAEPAEFQILNEEQARQFLIAASGSPFEALFYVALMTGMRKGEVLGLKWSDLDWEKGILLVQRQLQRVEQRGFSLEPPKTKAGRRPINLGHETLAQLRSHQKQQERDKVAAGDRWQDNDLIFPTTIGTFLDQRRVSREFKRLLRKADLPDIRFHDLRHTSISSLLELGTPVNTVQRRAGHAKASTTINIYGHTMPGSQENAAMKIEELITGVAVKPQSESGASGETPQI